MSSLSLSPPSPLAQAINKIETAALTRRAIAAINLVIIRELHEHDGVLVRLAFNLEQAWLANLPALTLELCQLIESCCARARMLEGAPHRTVFFRDDTASHSYPSVGSR